MRARVVDPSGAGQGSAQVGPPGPALRGFERPRTASSLWQLANTLVPYLALLACMVVALRRGFPVWLALAPAVPAAGFLVRLFILMHDCAHASFLPSRRAERLLGRVLGVLVFTPFAEWQHTHLVHHATSGDLDRRGTGDVWTLTVDEYRASSRTRRLLYRLTRHPVTVLLVGPLVLFGWDYRVPNRGARGARLRSVLLTDVAIAAMVVAGSFLLGPWTYLLVQGPVLLIGGACGIALFYVQHQFDPSYWKRGAAWNAVAAALQGSSFVRLPRLLQWFSGSIGYHHVHHLRPRIPNYNLERCHEATPALRATPPLSLAEGLACARLALWDEARGRFVGFRAAAAPGG